MSIELRDRKKIKRWSEGRLGGDHGLRDILMCVNDTCTPERMEVESTYHKERQIFLDRRRTLREGTDRLYVSLIHSGKDPSKGTVQESRE